jgi:stringent starvation protein B
MTSTRPYLIRALYEWIVDNQCTPHLLVEVKDDQTRVPRQFVDKGVIVLNVAPSAVKHLLLGNDRISFSARFGGTPHDIDVPVAAVQAIYARENGQGIFLGDASEENVPMAAVDGETPQVAQPGSKPPHLTIVK